MFRELQATQYQCCTGFSSIGNTISNSSTVSVSKCKVADTDVTAMQSRLTDVAHS